MLHCGFREQKDAYAASAGTDELRIKPPRR